MSRYLKVMCVGDHRVGKSSLSYRLRWGSHFSSDARVNVEDYWETMVTVQGTELTFGLWDTAGDDDYDLLRPLGYPGTDVVLMCFATENMESLKRVKNKWIPEIERYLGESVVHLIVQTKCDLWSERTKKNRYHLQLKHSDVLRHMLSNECEGYTSEEWMPTDLIHLILSFSEYFESEINYDEKIEANLIDPKIISEMVTNDLMIAGRIPPMIRTSAADGSALDDHCLYQAIWEELSRVETHAAAASVDETQTSEGTGKGCISM